MSNQITTLSQAAAHLISQEAVNMDNMTVEGKQLLEVCGFTKIDNTAIHRQIEKHMFIEGKDFMPSVAQSNGGRPSTIYTFTLNAANHVLLAAMTDKGKVARQDAIDTKIESTPVSTGNLMLDALIESQRQITEVKSQVESQQATLNKIESMQSIMNTRPANTVGITSIRQGINERHGLPAWIVTEVMHGMAYSPKPAGQVRLSHEEANGGTYTVWYKVEVTKLFARFVSECTMDTATFATHPHFEKRFKLTEK